MKLKKMMMPLVAVSVCLSVAFGFQSAFAFDDDAAAPFSSSSSYSQSLQPSRGSVYDDRPYRSDYTTPHEWDRDYQQQQRTQQEQQRAYNESAFGHTYYRDGQSVTCRSTGPNTSVCQ